jgi:hypothetical protein
VVFHETAAARTMARIRRVPDRYRLFTHSTADATRVHRIRPDLLASLLDLGLPHRGAGAERWFDRLDLENIGLGLRLPGTRWTAMRWWSSSFSGRWTGDPVTRTLAINAVCPAPDRPHPCRLRLDPLVAAAGVPGSVRRSPRGFTVDVTSTPVDHLFGEPFTPLIERIRPVEFHLLPESLTTDVGFALHSGLADCRLATRLLVGLGRELAVPVRTAIGVLLTSPFPTWHSWVEFDTGDRWLAADPFLLNAFARWAVVDTAEWPMNRSPQGLLWRWHDDQFPVVLHDGELAQAELVLPTR